MIKLKYSICCGLDVHKNVIVAAIVTTDKDGISEYKQRSFQPSTRIFRSTTTGLSRIIVIMPAWNPQESIGFLFLIISKTTLGSVLPTPKYVKAIKGKKTDKKDSKWIADLSSDD